MAKDLNNIDLEFIERLKNLTLKSDSEPLVKEEYEKVVKLPALARPDHGTRGVPIELQVNWFGLSFDTPEKTINVGIYEVTFKEIKRDAGQNRGRGRGRGRGGRGGRVAKEPPELSRANKQIALWRAVDKLVSERRFDSASDVIFDDHAIYVVKDSLEGGGLVQVDHPNEKINEKHQMQVSFRYAGYFPVNPNHSEQQIVDLSGRFIKALSTQRIRRLGGNQDEINFRANWHFQNGNVYQIPRGLVNPQADIELKVLPGIRAWIGVYAALKSGENLELFVNFGLINNLFYKMDIDLIAFYMEVCQELGEDVGPNFRRRLQTLTQYAMSPIQRNKMEKLVKDICVTSDKALMFEEERRPRDAPRNWVPPRPTALLATRHFKITKILPICPRVFRPSGQEMTMEEIYAAKQAPLTCPYLPVVAVSQAGKEYYQPMEVLRIHDTPQRYAKALNETDTKKYLQKVSRCPEKYWSETNRLLDELHLRGNQVPFFQQYKAQLSLEWTKCEGRILPSPTIRELDGEEHKLQSDRSYQIKEVAEAVGPIVIDVCTAIDPLRLEPILTDEQAGDFYYKLVRILKERNLTVDPRDPQNVKAQIMADKITNHRAGRLYIPDLDEHLDLPSEYICKPEIPTFAAAASYCQRLFQEDPDHEKKNHIMLVFTVKASDFYKRVKRVCDIVGNVPTLIVDRETVIQALNQSLENKYAIFYNLALKINGRLGGVNTLVDNPRELPAGDRDQIMYVGMDVTHPGVAPGKDNLEVNMNVSLAAIVGSIDVGSARYRTYPLAQMRVRETVERFDYQFVELLDDFYKANGSYPKHVVIYRDGVSDSEMIKNSCIELHWIKGSWGKIVQKDGIERPPPTFTYIVVQKRHHTRFIRPVEQDGKATFTNPRSGTTVDKKIVNSKMFDFWLTAHQVSPKVTARPIHYTVVYDEWKRSADEIQEMTYRLCFLNARCRKPCSLPAPVHYAHLACNYYKEVYRDFITQDPSEELTPERQGVIEKCLNVSKTYPGMFFV